MLINKVIIFNLVNFCFLNVARQMNWYLDDLKLHSFISLRTTKTSTNCLNYTIYQLFTRSCRIWNVPSQVTIRNQFLQEKVNWSFNTMSRVKTQLRLGTNCSAIKTWKHTWRQSRAVTTMREDLLWHANSKGKKYFSADTLFAASSLGKGRAEEELPVSESASLSSFLISSEIKRW